MLSLTQCWKKIVDDIIEGMTTGFTEYNSDGNKVRVFLDLVGFIGDTPAINAVLDVLGHTGSACCHLCKFMRKSESIVGSRYGREDFHSCLSSASRGYYQHPALRDSGAHSEACRLMGMKPADPEQCYPRPQYS